MTEAADLLARAMAAHRAGRLEEASALYGNCLAQDPGNADLLHLTGLLRHQAGDHAAGLELVGQALARRPDTPLYLGSQAAILLAVRRYDEAFAVLEQALAITPDDPVLLTRLGQVLARRGDPAAALANYDRALAIAPSHVDAMVNRGNLLEHLDRAGEAIDSLQAALSLAPGNADILNNLGFACLSGRRVAEAANWFDQAIRSAPDHVEAHINRAHLNLLSGRFEAGWRDYEWRRRRPGWRVPEVAAPEWRGEALAGKRIAVMTEQGHGDAIQFCRHAADLDGLGAEVHLLTDPPLRDLLATAPGVAAVHDDPAMLPDVDHSLPAMSLPLRLGIAGQVADGPYLHSTRGRGSERGIGICLFGNPRHWNDHRRSLPPQMAAEAELFRIPGLVSLHRELPAGLSVPGSLQARDDIRDFADLARIVAGLDLVITVDTAVAHLAGALGKPCWVLLPFLPDWRWGLEGETTPLYPTLRLFRQQAPGDWQGVLAAVSGALAAMGGGSA